MKISLIILIVFIGGVLSQGSFPLSYEGLFTGCFSPTGTTLGPGTFMTLFRKMVGNTAPPVASTAYIQLPNDPNPTVVNQDPNSLKIQFTGLAPLTRNQLCNGFTAPPLPGTSSNTAATGQEVYNGLYGAHIKIEGSQVNLPECNPPGVARVVCNPQRAATTLTFIDVTISEGVLTGFITPKTDPRATFNIANTPMIPIVYNSPVTNRNLISINAVVVDGFGFRVNPATVPIPQENAIAEGWSSKIAGENAFYYYRVTAAGGVRLPNQIIVADVRCKDQGDLKVVGAVSTSRVGTWPANTALGTVRILNARGGAALGTVVPTDVGTAIPTAKFTFLTTITTRCPRTIRITWTHPGIGLPAGASSTLNVPVVNG